MILGLFSQGNCPVQEHLQAKHLDSTSLHPSASINPLVLGIEDEFKYPSGAKSQMGKDCHDRRCTRTMLSTEAFGSIVLAPNQSLLRRFLSSDTYKY